jgi:hypothetical protein
VFGVSLEGDFPAGGGALGGVRAAGVGDVGLVTEPEDVEK